MNHIQTVGGLSPSLLRCLSGWLFVLAGFVTLASAASAQTGTITGRVINKGTGEYLNYAQVQVVGTDRLTLTTSGGNFTLTNVPAGEVKVSVVYAGLDTTEVAVTVPAGGSVSQEIALTSADYGETVQLGKFEVSSAREGNAKAIVEQRQSLNLKTVIAADAFGDISEGNVGEFLRLLPGVSVDYVDNDVRATRIRGIPPKYTSVTMDGHAVATASSSAINSGRQFEFEQLALTSVEKIENTKAPTPDMMSAALAGNTNAVSKSAFSQKGRVIKYRANASFNQWNATLKKTEGWDGDDHYKILPGGQVEFMDTFLDGKLGVVATAFHSGSYSEQQVVIGSQTWDGNAANNQQELPETTQWNFQHGLKPSWRDSFMVNLDYKATDDIQLGLRTSYSYYRAEFYNRNWLVNTNTAGIDTATQSENYHRVNATATTSTNQYARVLGSNQRKSGGTFVTSPYITWKRDNLKVDLSTSYSQAKNAYASGQDGYFSLVQADMTGLSWEYFKDGNSDVTIRQLQTANSNNASFLDMSSYRAAGRVNSERRNSKDQFWTANIDVEADYPDWQMPTTFKVGADTRLNVRDISNYQAIWVMSLTGGPTTATAINLGDYVEAFSPSVGDIRSIDGVAGEPQALDKWRIYELFESYGNTDSLSTAANGPFNADEATNLRNLLQNQFDIKEKIWSAYAMATVKPVKNLTVIAGLRFEKTTTQGQAFDDIGVDRTLDAIGVTYDPALTGTTIPGSKGFANLANKNRLDYIYARFGSRKTREQNFDNVLPVVQVRYGVGKSLVARMAYYASMLRPEFQNIVGGVIAAENDTNGSYSFTVRNATLDPETANNLDAQIEYYFEPVGVLSAGVFFKEIKNIQVNQPSQNLSAASPEILAQIESVGLSAAELGNELNSFTTVINGPKTSLWGVELAYQQQLSFLPGFLRDFSVNTNYTYIHPEDEAFWALVPNAGDGLAKNAFNFVLRYKYKKFNASVTASWSDKKITGLSGYVINAAGDMVPTVASTNVGLTQYYAARWQLNTSLEYQLHRNATFFLTVNNLLNTPQFRYMERTPFTTRHGTYGANINVGIKGQF